MIHKAMGMVEIFQREVQIRKKAKDGILGVPTHKSLARRRVQ